MNGELVCQMVTNTISLVHPWREEYNEGINYSSGYNPGIKEMTYCLSVARFISKFG